MLSALTSTRNKVLQNPLLALVPCRLLNWLEHCVHLILMLSHHYTGIIMSQSKLGHVCCPPLAHGMHTLLATDMITPYIMVHDHTDITSLMHTGVHPVHSKDCGMTLLYEYIIDMEFQRNTGQSISNAGVIQIRPSCGVCDVCGTQASALPGCVDITDM